MTKTPDFPNDKASSRRSTVQSATMAVAILKKLAEMGGAAPLTALAAALGESPAKVHRYLASLLDAELVVQDPQSGRYVLGPGAIAIGLAASRQSDVITLAAAEMAALTDTLQATCFLAVLGNLGPTIIRWVEPAQPVTVNVKVGSVLPILWSATGRAFAAFGPCAQLDGLMASELAAAATATARRAGLRDAQAAADLLAQVRRQGCAPLKDVLLVGVSAVAAPIFDVAGKAAAVLTALGPTGGFDPAADGPAAAAVRRSAATVSARLGWREPPAS